MIKVCKKCASQKEMCDNNFFRRTNGTFMSECKACWSKRCSDYKKQPHRKLKNKEAYKKYRTNNKDKCLLANKTSRAKKRSHYNQYERNRRNDVSVRLSKKLSGKKWREKNPGYQSPNKKISRSKHYKTNQQQILSRAKNSDRYIKLLLGSPELDIPPELIYLKREQLKLKRKIYEKTRQPTNIN